VPWHLTTREALEEVRRVLGPGGVYAVNLIDHGPLGFARAELATLEAVFADVALLASPGTVAGEHGGNLVAVAAERPVATAAVADHLGRWDTGWEVLHGDGLRRWIGDAQVLTDDHAPVDQLLTPYAPVSRPAVDSRASRASSR
jgi:hypothetical protein